MLTLALWKQQTADLSGRQHHPSHNLDHYRGRRYHNQRLPHRFSTVACEAVPIEDDQFDERKIVQTVSSTV